MTYKIKIIHQLMAGFITVALLLIVMGVLAIREANTLADLTEKMYLHPLTVSNAVLEANSNIIAMHRHMEDVVLARNRKDLDEAIIRVKKNEKLFYQHFDLVMLRFLGDKSQLTEVRKAFSDWEQVRTIIIELTFEKKYQEAVALTKSKEADLVVRLTELMNGLIMFARNKAMEFRKNSQIAHAQSIANLGFLMVLLLLIVGSIAVFVIVNFKRGQSDLRQKEEKYRHLFDTMAQGVVYQDGSGKIISVNNAALNILGLSLEQIQGRTLLDPEWKLFDDKGVALPGEIHPAMEALRTAKEIKNVVIGVYNMQQQKHHWVLMHSSPQIRPGEDKPYQVYSTFTDITELKYAEEELKKLSRAVESSSSAVFIVNQNGFIEYVNPKFSEITGYSRQEAIGQNPRLLKSGDTTDAEYQEMWDTITSGKDWKGRFHNRKKDGSLYWAQESISAVQGGNGEFTHFIAIQDDVTQEHLLTEQLSYQASHDLLTGLINRHEFEKRTERILLASPSGDADHALCFLDLDQFKVINDTCGHIAGDELLRQLGRILTGVVRKRDTLARLGGDEFGVLMEHCPMDQAYRVADTILKSIQEYQFSWEGKSFRVGVSIGLVSVTKSIPNITELLKQADAACYMAKDLGRNRIHMYNPEDIELAQRQGEMQWVTRIHQALEENRFCLFAQPIISLNNSSDIHYELLIRMQDEEGKIIPPGAFLTAAERYNLIGILDTWVIKKAFTTLAANPKFVENIHFVTINLSGQSLTSSNFLEFISTQLRETGIDAHKICFEVTETVAISNLNSAITFISILKEIGCHFALDDFGSGLSSFGYLKNLPVDYLKIDGMFVKDIVEDPIDREMVKSINDIGHVMGMQTVAEFVENDEILKILKDIGVDFAQGYGLGKPRLFDEVIAQSL